MTKFRTAAFAISGLASFAFSAAAIAQTEVQGPDITGVTKLHLSGDVSVSYRASSGHEVVYDVFNGNDAGLTVEKKGDTLTISKAAGAQGASLQFRISGPRNLSEISITKGAQAEFQFLQTDALNLKVGHGSKVEGKALRGEKLALDASGIAGVKIVGAQFKTVEANAAERAEIELAGMCESFSANAVAATIKAAQLHCKTGDLTAVGSTLDADLTDNVSAKARELSVITVTGGAAPGKIEQHADGVVVIK